MNVAGWSGQVWWLEPMAILAIGTAMVVLATAGAAHPLRGAVWRRMLWRAATVAMWLLIAFELSGAAPAVVDSLRSTSMRTDRAAPPADDEFTKTIPDEPLVAEAPTADLLSQTGSAADPRGDAAESEAAMVPAQMPSTEPSASGLVTVKEFSPTAGGPLGEDDACESSERTPGAAALEHNTAMGHTGRQECAAWPVALWLFGTFVLACRMVVSRVLLTLFVALRTAPVDASLVKQVAVLARQLNMRRSVRVRCSCRLVTPVACGVGRPTVVVPATWPRHFDHRHQDAMLAHEVAHLASRDPLWQLLADVLVAVLWWHPGVWWSRRQLRWTSELAADEASRVVPGGPGSLAACLVVLGQRLSGAAPGVWLSIEGPRFRSGLARRVERLVHLPHRMGPEPQRSERMAVTTLIPLCLVMVILAGTAGMRSPLALAEGEPTMSLMRNPLQRSLLTVALAGWVGAQYAADPADASPTTLVPPAVAAQDAPPDDGPPPPGEDDVDRHRERPPGESEEPPFWAPLRDRVRELLQRRKDLEQEGQALQRELEAGRDRPEGEEQRELGQRLDEVSRLSAEIAQEVRELSREGANTIRQHVRELRESGRQEAAEQMMRQAEKLAEQAARLGERRGGPEPPDDLQRRIEHLKVAIDHLHAAGFHEPAERFHQELERMRDQQQAERRERPEQPPRPEPPRRPRDPQPPREPSPPRFDGPPRDGPRPDGPPHDGPRPDGPPPQRDRDMNMDQLRHEQRQLREEMQEMRQMLKELLERQRR